MKTYIYYRDIDKGERKRLAMEASKQPRLRVILFVSILIPLLLSGVLADSIVSKNGPFWEHLVVRLVSALILAGIIWEIFGRRRLRADIEKLKNA